MKKYNYGTSVVMNKNGVVKKKDIKPERKF